MSLAIKIDAEVRKLALEELRRVAEPTNGVLTRQQMEAGFVFGDERISFAHERVGIWRPKILSDPGAALSLTTAAVRPGVVRRYDDQVGGDDWFAYRYQGEDRNHWHNRAVRKAMELGVPLIYFYGLTPGYYEAVYPVYVVKDDPENLTFSLAADAIGLGEQSLMIGGGASPLKEYATRQVKIRLHQHRFRELVLGAYGHRCTICKLGHSPLLDAAHIIADRDERGRPEVPNGLSLCKIHHTAYDVNILGINPDFRVEIREDILAERDGPMLRHGLQELNHQQLHLPRALGDRPNRDYLKSRYVAFRAA
jgi:putative restriction endonuclease